MPKKKIAIVIGGPMDGQIIETDQRGFHAYRVVTPPPGVRRLPEPEAAAVKPTELQLVVYYRCYVPVQLRCGVFDVNAFMVDLPTGQAGNGHRDEESIYAVGADTDVGKLAIKAFLQGLAK